MAKPTVRVRIAFADGPYVASPTWTDVTSYVRSINTSRGRNDDWQNFDSGSANVTLDNRDRRFDPTYTSGPYYGNLQPRRQIIIDATTDNVTYYGLFRGYIDGWPVTLSDAGYDSTVSLSCYDLLGLTAQEQCPADWSHQYIVSNNPTHYWRLDDAIDPAQLTGTAGSFYPVTLKDSGSSPNDLNGYYGTPTQNSASLAAGIESQTVAWPIATYWFMYNASTTPTYSSHAGAFSSWVQIPNTGNVICQLFYNVAGTYRNVIITANTSNITVSQAPNLFLPGTIQVRTTGAGIDSAVPHHIFVNWSGLDGAFSASVWIDGAPQTMTSSTVSGTVGMTAGINVQLGGVHQQVAIWEGTTLGTSVATDIFALGANRLTESTSSRFTRIIQNTSVPAALYSVTGSPAGTVSRLSLGGEMINNELQLTADSEGGELYVSRDGILTMTNRTWYQGTTSATSQATFGTGGTPIQTEMSYYWTAQGIRNALDVEYAGGSSVKVSNASSIASYGTQQESYKTNLATLTDAQNLGNLLVNFGQMPRLVMSAIEIGQAASTTQWTAILQLELLQRITVVVPERTGSDLSQQQLIQQIEHEITPGDWKTRILGSSRWSSVFILDTSSLDAVDLLG